MEALKMEIAFIKLLFFAWHFIPINHLILLSHLKDYEFLIFHMKKLKLKKVKNLTSSHI